MLQEQTAACDKNGQFSLNAVGGSSIIYAYFKKIGR